jgi:hypothetical protein
MAGNTVREKEMTMDKKRSLPVSGGKMARINGGLADVTPKDVKLPASSRQKMLPRAGDTLVRVAGKLVTAPKNPKPRGGK